MIDPLPYGYTSIRLATNKRRQFNSRTSICLQDARSLFQVFLSRSHRHYSGFSLFLSSFTGPFPSLLHSYALSCFIFRPSFVSYLSSFSSLTSRSPLSTSFAHLVLLRSRPPTGSLHSLSFICPAVNALLPSDECPFLSVLRHAQILFSFSVLSSLLRNGGSGLCGSGLDGPTASCTCEPSAHPFVQYPSISFAQCTVERSKVNPPRLVHRRTPRTTQRSSRTFPKTPSSRHTRCSNLPPHRGGV